ncbi:MAG: hypothetical protein WCR52_22150 [Bacteroidota bacterium]
MKQRFLLALCFLTFRFSGTAQVFYGDAGTSLYSFSYVNGVCSKCLLQPLNGITPVNLTLNGDLFVLPNGDIIITRGTQLLMYTLPDPNPVVNLTFSFIVTGTAEGPNGLIYVIGIGGNNPLGSSLYTYDPVTTVFTLIGNFPGNNSLTDLYYFNGQLYASGSSYVYLVNTANPAASIPQNSGISSDFAIADEGFYIGSSSGSGPPAFGQFNPTTGANNILCTLTPPVPGGALQQIPASAPQPPLCCATEAGLLPGGGPFNTCINAPFTFFPAINVVLDNNDLLRYILFSNPADTLGSILLTSSTPSFTFNPAVIQTGVPYYIAAIAGNNQGGNVNLNDPCLDISNGIQVTWGPLPAVTLSVANPNICAGTCTTITANFTGTPPFTLTYITPLGTSTQVFSASTSTFQVCAPAAAPPGSFSIQVTALTDVYCTCN